MRHRNLIVLLTVIFLVGSWWFLKKPASPNPSNTSPTPQTLSNQKPAVVSSSPTFPTEGYAVVIPSQTLEITFNLPFENPGEVKYQIDPKVDLKVELSPDRLTVKFTPIPAFKLGTIYTLSIKPDSKFNVSPGKNETKVVLDHNFDFHFRTLEYRGI